MAKLEVYAVSAVAPHALSHEPNAHSTRDASDAFVRARLKYSPYFCAHFSFPRGESRLPISHNHSPVSTFRIAKHASGGV